MTLKTSFASVLRALRNKRNISQRDFADTTSRTYLSKLELGKSSITLDKLGQISNRLELSPLTLLTLTLSEDTGRTPVDLMSKLTEELSELQRDGGLPGLRIKVEGLDAARRPRMNAPKTTHLGMRESRQAELAFAD
ncbi:helix-turn-helix domain-containing protein [Pseudomonas sp. NPDC089395]|uniref:helix-turn-helix domain-containing protein n=1 Tax=unclassified Pseudomonas TaxID=196821 RepID=UPI0037FC97FD